MRLLTPTLTILLVASLLWPNTCLATGPKPVMLTGSQAQTIELALAECMRLKAREPCVCEPVVPDAVPRAEVTMAYLRGSKAGLLVGFVGGLIIAGVVWRVTR